MPLCCPGAIHPSSGFFSGQSAEVCRCSCLHISSYILSNSWLNSLIVQTAVWVHLAMMGHPSPQWCLTIMFCIDIAIKTLGCTSKIFLNDRWNRGIFGEGLGRTQRGLFSAVSIFRFTFDKTEWQAYIYIYTLYIICTTSQQAKDVAK